MKNVIHIYGASGSGTSTLAKYISNKLDFYFMDTDDYFWLPTDPPYTQRRNREDRIQLIKSDIEKNNNVVISGSLSGWGNELIPCFTLVVRLVTETSIRIERLEQREEKLFGQRILPGGDMYDQHQEFIKWAAAYDTGDINMRSKTEHDEWQKKLWCKQIVLDGNADLQYNLEEIEKELQNYNLRS